jgi:DNA polymerase-3 subunit alpha
MKSFNHLHVHSHFSLLNALPRIPDLIDAAKNDGMTALALTDNGNLYGAIEFYEKCLAAEIKPILGIDAYVAIRSRLDKEARIDNKRHRLVLLAKNHDGYKNIIKLVTDSHLKGFYYKPRIDKETVQKWNTDLVCISPAFSGEISDHLRNNEKEKAKETLEFYKGIYGDDFYLEILHHPELEDFEKLTAKIIEFAKETDTKLVAAQDTYYINEEDRDAWKTLKSVGSSFGGKDNSFENGKENFSFITQKQANELFKDTPEALDNIQEIVDKCNIEITLAEWKFPDFKIPSGKTAEEELRDMTFSGLEKRKYELTDEIKERIEYELEVINTKGYAKYFLVVADIYREAKERKILSNTRGSAAGSFVSYLIGITDVDPIVFGLPFERFLNPGRPSAPDIDMDFADERRDELIDYCREKYGAGNVAQIGTFGTMLARGAVRDTARAMGFDYEAGDRIAKLIPMGAQGFPMTIDRALSEVEELDQLYKSDDEAEEIINMARKIEGCARHIGVHAAGVVISPEPLEEYVPVQFDPKGENKLITQYDMHAVGEDGIGLLKFDFLGLKNLTILGKTLKLIKAIHGKEIEIDEVPLDDTKTFEMLSRGDTAATFQLNGSGMTRFLKELKPNCIDDINAMVALYRPGPMAFIPDYIERKNDPSKVKYVDNRFKEFIEKTYGILIYQDDIMLIAVHFAGYSWGEADKFRKAMGKKIPELMAEQKEKFSKGCKEVGGLSDKQTKELWESIETFAAYGFNKGHAASYGRVAYLTSYFKANYPVIYMASVLTADSGDVDKISEMVAECKHMGINVLPPDINESFSDFTVVNNKETGAQEIRFGLTTIKNFGEGIADEIIEEREKNGKFTSLEDFISRINSRSFNKKSLEALIKTGALDKLDKRGHMLENLEEILEYNKEIAKSSDSQDSLFGNSDLIQAPKLKLRDAEPISMDQKLEWEKELLGLYISGHPLDKYKEQLGNSNFNLAKIKKESLEKLAVKNKEKEQIEAAGKKINWKERDKYEVKTKVIGHVETVREINTKKGDLMAFVKIADVNDAVEIVLFPKTYADVKEIIKPGACLIVKGNASDRNGEFSVLVDKVATLDSVVNKK